MPMLSSWGAQQISGSYDPFASYLPTAAEKQKLPSVSGAIDRNTLDGNVVAKAQEDPAGFFEKVARFGSGGWDGLKYGFNYGAAEQAYRSWRTLGLLLGDQSMQDTATAALSEMEVDPERKKAMNALEDPVARQAFEGMASVVPSLALAVPGVVAGLLTGGAGWVPVVTGMIAAGGGSGLAEYDSFIEQAHAELSRENGEGWSVENTRDAVGDKAFLSALAEGGIDAATELIGGRLARKVAMPFVTSSVGRSLNGASETLNRNFWGRLLTNTFVTSPMSEVPGELATAGVQDKLKEWANLSHEGMAAAMQNALVPALIASFPFGAAKTLQFNPSANVRAEDARAEIKRVNDEMKAATDFAINQSRLDLLKSPSLKAFSIGLSEKEQANPTMDGIVDMNKVVELRDKYLPGATDEEAKAISILVSDITPEAFTDIQRKLPEAPIPEGENLYDTFRDYMVGKKDNLTPEQDSYFSQLEQVVIQNLEAAQRAKLLGATATGALRTLKHKANKVFDTAFQDRYIENMSKTLDLKELAQRVGKKVVEDEQKILFGKDPERFKEFLKEGGMFTNEYVMSSQDPEVIASIGHHMAREAGFDPTKAMDGRTITREDIAAELRKLADHPDDAFIYRSVGFLKGLEDNNMIVAVAQAKQDAYAKASVEKYTRALAADSTLTNEERTALIQSSQQSFARSAEFYGIRALSARWGGRALQQSTGSSRAHIAEVMSLLRESMSKNIENDANPSVGLVKSQAEMVLDICRMSKMPVNKQTKIIVKNLEQRVKLLTEAAAVDPNMSVDRAKAMIEPLDKGADDSILQDLLDILNNPNLNEDFKSQMRKTKMGFLSGLTKEFAYNNMLSSPKTLLGNVFSQGLSQTQLLLEKALGTTMFENEVGKTGVSNREWRYALQGVMKAIFGGSSLDVFRNNRYAGRAAWDVIKGSSLRTLVTEDRIESQSVNDPYISSDRFARDIAGYTSYDEMMQSNGLSPAFKLLGKLTDMAGHVFRTPSRLLEGTDEFAELVAYSSAMEGYLGSYREANGGAKPDADTMENFKAMATEEARAVTFKEDLKRNDGMFMKLASGIDRVRTSSLPLQLVVPFFRVGVNIAYRFATSNPITARFTEYHRLATQSGDPRRIMEAESRVILGSVMTYGALMLASAGLVTGAAPVSKEERDMWEAAGNQAYSIRIGDTWVSYQRSDPIASFLATAANLTSAATHLDKKDTGQGLGTLFAMATMSTFDKTFFKGIHGAMTSLFNPGTGNASFLENAISMFIPMGSAMKGFQQATREDAVVSDDFMTRLRIRYLPADYADKDVGVQRNILGEAVQTPSWRSGEDMPVIGGGVLGHVASVFAPTEFRSAKSTPVYDELYRLKADGHSLRLGDATQISFKDSSRRGSVERRLLMNEQSRYKELRGQLVTIRGRNLQDALGSLFNSPQYNTLSDEDKAYQINRITNNYSNLAKVYLVREYPEIMRRK